MSDFAKDQLKKYGWTEGKGLGKNETGITKAINLVANQNKAGIGFDENVPWWESLYDNTIKTIQIDRKVSLPVVDTTLVTRPMCIQSSFSGNSSLGRLPMHWFIKPETLPKIEFTNARFHGFDPQPICSDKTVPDTIKDELISPSSGKLKRIEKQDREFLHKPLLNAPPAGENDMAYRSINIESDMEEKEHEIDNNESIPPSEESFFDVKSKSTKKRHRRRINKLLEQLNGCNLKNPVEEIDRPLDLDNIASSKIPTITKKSDTDLIDFSCKDYKPCKSTGCIGISKKHKSFTMIGKSFRRKKMEHLKKQREEHNEYLASQININEILFSPDVIMRHKRRNKIENSTTGNLVTKDKQHTDIIDFVPLTCFPDLTSCSAGSLKLEKSSHYDTFCRKGQMLKCLLNQNVEYDALNKLNNKIQKKKDQHYRSKNIKRIVEKMKGEVLTQELNSVIKNLTTFNLTEEVNANTIKKRPTQTHLTPV